MSAGMLKVLSVVFYAALLPPISRIATVTFTSVDVQYWFFIIIMFLPEISYAVSKKFRIWLKNGIEDDDGRFQKDDFNSLMTHYSTLICIRLFAVFGLRETFYQIQVRDIWIVATLSGGFGIEVVSFFIRRGEKKKE